MQITSLPSTVRHVPGACLHAYKVIMASIVCTVLVVQCVIVFLFGVFGFLFGVFFLPLDCLLLDCLLFASFWNFCFLFGLFSFYTDFGKLGNPEINHKKSNYNKKEKSKNTIVIHAILNPLRHQLCPFSPRVFFFFFFLHSCLGYLSDSALKRLYGGYIYST